MKMTALRIAFRELSGGLKGFWIYLACLALGTAAIAAAGSVTEVFTQGLDNQARNLLGGDLSFSTAQRRANLAERKFAETLGNVTETVGLDAMASAGDVRRQVDIRAVDSQYPLLGQVQLGAGTNKLQTAIGKDANGVWGAVVSRSFLDTFKVDIGETVTIGTGSYLIRARLDKLPDRVGTPGTFGPMVVLHLDTLISAGRVTPGQIFNARLRVVTVPEQDVAAIKTRFEAEFTEPRMRLRGPEDAVDGLKNLLSMLNSFLSMIGIAALVAGGIGVSQATSAFLNERLLSIAALKALGAEGALIRNIYLIQLGALALLGSGIGMVIGAAAPYILIALAGQDIPLPQQLGIYPVPLLKALVLGLLSAALFFLPAIGRARSTPPSALFRMISAQQKFPTPWLERIFTGLAGLALAMVAMLTSARPVMTFFLLLGAGISWGLFHLVAWGIRKIAARAGKNCTGYLRLILANLAGPGSLAPTIVPALGLGLALLTLVGSVQSNLLTQISQTAPQNAPSMVFSQIPNDKVETFDRILQEQGVNLSDASQFRQAPFILARVIAIKGAPVDMDKIARSEQWVVRGETSLTYLAKKPADTKLTAGKWWDETYTGPLLVSVEADAAKGLRIDIGDTLTFRVFGREVVATVSSLRVVDWGTFSIGSNTAFILSPGTLEAAKPYFVAIAKTAPETEAGIIAALGKQVPEVVVFQTRPALEAAAKLFTDVALVINGAAGVVTLAGLLVLLGTFAVMARRRQNEAALLKVFGAARHEVLQLYATEFALAGAAAAVFGTIIGVGASYPIVVFVFEAGWSLPIKQAVSVVALAVLLAAAGGLSVGLATLAKKPMRVLREH